MYGGFQLSPCHVDSLSPNSQSACSSSAHMVQKPESCGSRKPTSKRPLGISARRVSGSESLSKLRKNSSTNRNWEGHELTHADKRFISVTLECASAREESTFLHSSRSLRFIGKGMSLLMPIGASFLSPRACFSTQGIHFSPFFSGS